MNDVEFKQLQDEHTAADKKMKRLWNRIRKETARRADDYFKILWAEGELSPKDVMGVNWRLVTTDGEINWWDKFQQYSYQLSGMAFSGYIVLSEKPWITQVGLQVQFDQNKPFEEQLDILKFTRWLKVPVKGQGTGAWKNAKYIDIMEHNLSEHASYHIEFVNQKKARLCSSAYFRVEAEFEGTLRQVLKHVYKKYPYIVLGEKF